ncbi:TetR/AcrR family transcriptional regulator [Nocardiopsis nanhaiensis]
MSDRRPTPQEQQRREAQRTIQEHAVRLFGERGYDATSVADVAEAAGVSAETVDRHFPEKEDLVLADRFGPLAAEQIAAISPAQPLVRRVGIGLIRSAEALTGAGPEGEPAANERFQLTRHRLVVTTPALRARHLDRQDALQRAIVDALGPRAGGLSVMDFDGTDPEVAGSEAASDAVFQAQAAVSACLAAMHTALVRWVEDEGRDELPDVVAGALTAAFGFDFEDLRSGR